MAASSSRMRLPDPPALLLAALTDDLLGDILIRLPTLADLGRACLVCVAFHRVISGHSFLRRLRVHHPPPLLGIMSLFLTPAEPPHPCATLARAIGPAVAVGFRCSFLPSPDRWHYRDFRDGRVLLAALPAGIAEYNTRALLRELCVCDPLHRRYQILPIIPEDLIALINHLNIVRFSPFLAPSEEGEGGTSFRVICLVECQTKLVLFILSSISGSWHAAEFDDGWRALTTESSNPAPGSQRELDRPYYAHGCFCWVMHWSHKLLVLDMRTMEFSSIDIPQIHPPRPRAIVEAGGGKFGMFTLCVDMEYGGYELLYAILQSDGNGTTWWRSEACISLGLNYRYNIMGVAGGYLLLEGLPEALLSIPSEQSNIDYLSVNLKTLKVEWFCETQKMVNALLCVAFPPSLSAPTI